MQHEPSGLLRYSNGSVNLPRANAILAANQKPESREPLLQRDWRILEDGINLDGELAATGAALPPLLSLEVIGIHGVPTRAVRATWAIGPAHSGYSVNTNLFVAKVLNRFE
jgi:hypothetical protein